MRRGLAVVLLASCNAVYSLDQTHLPPPDAALRCPDIGATSMEGAPHFSRKLEQIGNRACAQVTMDVSTGIAIAACNTTLPTGSVQIARLAGDLTLAQDFTPLAIPVGAYSYPRLAADGDRLFVKQNTQWVVFSRDGDAWIGPAPSAIQLASEAIPSSITHGPDRRIVALSPTELTEYAFDTGTIIKTYKFDEIGFAPRTGRDASIALTADGLRLVAAVSNGIDQLLYTDRPSIALPFRRAVVLDLPPVADPFLLEDCARLYYSSETLGALFATRVEM